jgi:hypothetical protein
MPQRMLLWTVNKVMNASKIFLLISDKKWHLFSFQQAALVLNASRRFRYTLDLKKEEEKEMIRRKIRSHAQVIRVLCHLHAKIFYFLLWLFHCRF